MLTRAGVAKRLGRSLATVRRMEGTELHPWIDERGVHRFDPTEVQEVLARDVEPLASPVSQGPSDANEMGETRAALLDAQREISRLKQRLLNAEADLANATEHARHAKSESQALRETAIEALGIVETLLEGDTPYAVSRVLRDLRRAG